jgi:hypothetical protein
MVWLKYIETLVKLILLRPTDCLVLQLFIHWFFNLTSQIYVVKLT